MQSFFRPIKSILLLLLLKLAPTSAMGAWVWSSLEHQFWNYVMIMKALLHWPFTILHHQLILHEDTLIPDMYSNLYLDPNLCVSKKGVCPSTGPNDHRKLLVVLHSWQNKSSAETYWYSLPNGSIVAASRSHSNRYIVKLRFCFAVGRIYNYPRILNFSSLETSIPRYSFR